MNNPVVTGYLYGWLMNAIGVLSGQKLVKRQVSLASQIS